MVDPSFNSFHRSAQCEVRMQLAGSRMYLLAKRIGMTNVEDFRQANL